MTVHPAHRRPLSVERVSVTVPRPALRALDARVHPGRRSAFLVYAAQAMLARLDGEMADAVEYEVMARRLCTTQRAGGDPGGGATGRGGGRTGGRDTAGAAGRRDDQTT